MKLFETLTYEPVKLAFGTSGLRGLVSDMTDLECYINTVGFLRFAAINGLQPGATIPVGGDLRHSTARIVQTIVKAVTDQGYKADYCGLLPTPALALYAYSRGLACVMVSGSHIPDDRNGIKFYKPDGEVLKSDEAAIKEAVAEARDEIYNQDATTSPFDSKGMFASPPQSLEINPLAEQGYLQRYLSLLDTNIFKGKHIIIYQHSSAGRDMLVTIFEALGATVTATGRSEVFIPIDTENVTPRDQIYFKELAQEFPDAFAIVSADGDADRPFVIDATGTFHRGDVLGCIVAQELGADFAALPISASDAVDESLQAANVEIAHTKIGSPYVIDALIDAHDRGKTTPVGWEVNGGFISTSDINYHNKPLAALPTRDAFLPILMCLAAAVHKNKSLAALFAELPARYTQAGLLDNFPQADSTAIVQTLAKDDALAHKLIAECFTAQDGFDDVETINAVDGVRITFKNGDIAHIRPSGNAPQLRLYSVADSQKRANLIVEIGLRDNGMLKRLQKLV